MKLKIKMISLIVFIIIIIILSLNSIVTIPTGKVGIKTQFGKVIGDTLEAGLSFKIPFVQKINTMNCQVQKVEVDSSSASKDLQVVTTKVAINYNIDKTTATQLFKNVGVKYQDIIINPTIQESLKGVTAQYTAEELITKRNEVSEKITQKLIEKLSEKSIQISAVNIINFDFSAEYNKAIEAKQVAQQQVLTEKENLEKIKVQAEQKLVEAKATSEANKMQEQSLTQGILTKMAIDKWNGSLPTTMATDTVPFLNIK